MARRSVVPQLPPRCMSPPAAFQTTAAREAALLAPYALRSCDSRGRRYPEAEHPYRGPFQRDRDRIVHSAAYRRLSGKMQVFTGDMGDYHRTRLTHTYEVASIARTMARALRLNEDLVEALALFHDIGHPPFGHAGEDALNECLAPWGGFSHNRQALAIAEELEARYPDFPGLNLTRETLDGQSVRADKASALAAPQSPLLEVQIVDLADSITYDAHDTDDAVQLGLVPLEALFDLPLVRQARERARSRSAELSGKMLRLGVVHELIDIQVTDVLQHAGRELLQREFSSADEARHANFRLSPSNTLQQQKLELETFLYQQVYRHPRLIQVRREAQARLRAMFNGYQQQLDRLPPKYQARALQVGLPRAVGDYLAGMTDRFCDDQYRRYFSGTSPK
ncbi:MAG: dNTP triphosphohydrolase [Pirellulales bacterium]